MNNSFEISIKRIKVLTSFLKQFSKVSRNNEKKNFEEK